MDYGFSIVADGYGRARSALEPAVRAEVTAEYAEPLQKAGFWMRLHLRMEIAAEVRRRLDTRVSRDACY